jgi:hypothetical protein
MGDPGRSFRRQLKRLEAIRREIEADLDSIPAAERMTRLLNNEILRGINLVGQILAELGDQVADLRERVERQERGFE